MKVYGSKQEIYGDGYAIAVKFVPQFPVRDKGNYPKLFAEMQRRFGWVINQFSSAVQNIDPVAARSFGFFLDVPATGSSGKPFSVRHVLLAHETGLELFLVGAGAYIADKVFEAVLQDSVEKCRKFLAEQWQRIIDPEGQYRIDHVEIRTERKGVMLLPFDEFKVEQLFCLLDRFDKIEHLAEVNGLCFRGQLTAPPEVHPGYGEVLPNSRD
jgi:hypothetical protein